MPLQGNNIQIYQITGKKPSSYNSTEFTLHKDVPYLQKTTANKVYLANEPPFTNYKVGDKVGIAIDRTSLRFPNVEQGKIYKNSAVVAKLVAKDPSILSYKNIPIYKSEEFEGE
jgi:hypothetical protein